MKDILINEYQKLKKEAKSKKRIIYSENPRITKICSIRVDIDGVCDIELYDPDRFDFQGFINYIRNIATTPKPKLIHKILYQILPIRHFYTTFEELWHDAWEEKQKNAEEQYAVVFPEGKTHLVTIQKLLEGEIEEITFLEHLFGFLSPTNIADFKKYYEPEKSGKAYNFVFWKGKYYPDFIQLFVDEELLKI